MTKAESSVLWFVLGILLGHFATVWIVANVPVGG